MKSTNSKVNKAWENFQQTGNVKILSENVKDDAFLGGYDASQNREDANTNARAEYKKWCAARPGVGCPDVAREFLAGWKDGMSGIEEGKYDYNKRDKGKGAGITSPMYDGGAQNRKNRKAHRKAEKAKAHQARMRGDVEEGENVDEGIFGNPADKKIAIIQYASRKAEDAIRLAQLGIELNGKHAKLFADIRKELVELKVWLRQRK